MAERDLFDEVADTPQDVWGDAEKLYQAQEEYRKEGVGDVGFGMSTARAASSAFQGIPQGVNSALGIIPNALDRAAYGVTGGNYNPQLTEAWNASMVAPLRENRRELAIQPEETLTTPGTVGQFVGQGGVDIGSALVTAPLSAASLPARLGPIATEAATGALAMQPQAQREYVDAFDRSGSIPAALSASAFTTAGGAVPMGVVASQLETAPARFLSRAAQGASLSIPIGAVQTQAQNYFEGTNIPAFGVDTLAGSVPEILLTGAFGRRVARNPDLPLTSQAVASREEARIETLNRNEQAAPTSEPDGVPATQEQPAQQPPDIFDEIAATEQPAVTPEVAGVEPQAPVVEAPSVPVYDQPSTNLPARAESTVSPRPEREGRDTSKREAWDEQYGGMRKGGRTHNDDGTPYQPTVYDEVASNVFATPQTPESLIASIGVDSELNASGAIKDLLSDGWAWDSEQGRMVNPTNPSETPSQGVYRINVPKESATPSQQTQPQIANELPETYPDVPISERQARAQQSVLGAIQIVKRAALGDEQAAGGGDLSKATTERQLGQLEEASHSFTEANLESLQDRRTKTTEHDVYYDPTSDRYVKVLQRGQYGLVPRRNAEGEVTIENATLPEYLDRLRLTNEVFGTDIQLEGVARRADELDDSKSTSDIVTSQTNIRPLDPDNANPTPEQISEFMQEQGFSPVKGVNKWERTEDGLLVADAKPDNFILTENGVVPIDLLISQKANAEQSSIPVAEQRNSAVEATAQEAAAEIASTPPQEAEVASLVNETSVTESPVGRLLESEVRSDTLQKIGGRLGIPEQERGDFAGDVATRILRAEEAGTGFKAPEGASPEAVQKAFRGYVNTVAENLAKDRRVASGAAKRNAPEVSLNEDLEGGGTRADLIPDRPSTTPDDAIQTAGTELLNELTSTEQDVLRSVVMGGQSQVEVAKRLGVSKQRVAQIQKSALTKMRQKMSERGFSREDLDLDSDAEFPNYGPGAANVLEFLENPPRTTSTMNRVMQEERRLRGESPILNEAVQTNPETLELAEQAIDANPNVAQELVTTINNGTKASVSPVEEGILLIEKTRLMNERQMEADRASDPYASQESRDIASASWKELESKINDIDRATKRSGQIWGQFGQFRQRQLRDDYTLEAVERKARVAGQAPLTPEEQAKLKKLTDEYSTNEKEVEALAQLEEQKKRNKALDDTVKDLKRQVSGFKIDPRILDYANKIVAGWETAAEAASQRLREKMRYASAGVDPTILADFIIIARAKIGRGLVSTVERFRADTISEYGDGAEPYIQDAWDAAQKELDNVGSELPKADRAKVKKAIKESPESVQTQIAERIRDRVESGDPLESLSDPIRRLALEFIRKGVTEREAVLDSVHNVVKEIVPDISRETTGDLLSRYGQFKELDKDSAKQQLRAVVGELQQLGKIRDLDKGEAPKKTGSERRTPGAEERRLQKIVNEKKRKGGYIVTDPATQLKTAQDSIKTRLRNELEEIEKAILDRVQRVKKESTVTDDAEITELRAALDKKRAEYNEIFPKEPLTDEQLMQRMEASLDRSITQLEKDLKAGKLYTDPKRKLSSEGIRIKQAQLRALRNERQSLRDLDTEVVEQNKRKALLGAIDRASTELEDVRRGVDTVDTQEVAALKEQLRQAQLNRRAARDANTERAEAKVEADLLRRIERAQEKPAPEGNKTPYTADTKRVASLRARLAEIQEANATSPEAMQKKIDQATASVEKSIADLNRRIEEGDFEAKERKEPVTSPELEVLRAERKAMQGLLRELKEAEKPKKTPEEAWLQRRMTYLTNLEAKLREKLATGDLDPKPKPVYTKTKELVEAESRLSKIRRDINNEIFQRKLKSRPLIQKGLDTVAQAIQTVTRGIFTGFDFGAVFNQAGLTSISNPKLAIQNLGTMFKQFASEKYYHKTYRDLLERDNAPLYESSGLALVDPESGELSKMEEAYQSRWNKYIPGVAHSERAYVGFLNQIRADYFDQLTNNLRDADGRIDSETAKSVAQFVNVATGRGSLGGGPKWFDLNNIFFSPRLLSSRIEYLLGTPAWQALAKGDRRGAALIAKEMAKFYTNAAIVFTLLTFAGASVNTDPNSPDFMKIKFGNYRFDPLGGLPAVATLISRLFTGHKTTMKGKDVDIRRSSEEEKMPYGGESSSDLVWRFVKNKFNPVVGTSLNLLDGQNVIGEYVGPKEAALGFIPMSGADLYKSIQESGPYSGTALGLANLFGLRMQIYQNEEERLKTEAMARP